jgi:hypothetical protein
VSIDTPKPDTYKKMHGVEIGGLVKNIIDLIAYRNKTKSKCTVGLKTLISGINLPTMEEDNKALENIGADYIQRKYARACDGGLNQGKNHSQGQMLAFTDTHYDRRLRRCLYLLLLPI